MDRWRSVEPYRRPRGPRTPEDVVAEAKVRFGPQRGRESWEEYAEHSLTHDDLPPVKPLHKNPAEFFKQVRWPARGIDYCWTENSAMISFFSQSKGELCLSKSSAFY